MKDLSIIKQQKRKRRQNRLRAKIGGVAEKPRLSVFRSLSHIYAQLIDDRSGRTLAAANDLELTDKAGKMPKAEKAKEVGKLLAEKSVKAGIKKVVFDRGGYKYHGRVRALAEGAREGGLDF